MRCRNEGVTFTSKYSIQLHDLIYCTRFFIEPSSFSCSIIVSISDFIYFALSAFKFNGLGTDDTIYKSWIPACRPHYILQYQQTCKCPSPKVKDQSV